MNTPNEMTLRDWFAGQALAGWAAGRNRDTNQTSGAPDYIARTSYGYADAMIVERERRERARVKAADEAGQKAHEWIKANGLKLKCGGWGGVCVVDGGLVLGEGCDIVAAVADARATLATDPAPLAPSAQPAPSTPTGEDDEAWAMSRGVTWQVRSRGEYAFGSTAEKAIRALRAKVEGGAQ